MVSGSLLCRPAGTLAIHHQSILHRRGKVSVAQPRHMMKHNYFRTRAPTRDWIVQPEFDRQSAYYGGHDIARFVGKFTSDLPSLSIRGSVSPLLVISRSFVTDCLCHSTQSVLALGPRRCLSHHWGARLASVNREPDRALLGISGAWHAGRA